MRNVYIMVMNTVVTMLNLYFSQLYSGVLPLVIKRHGIGIQVPQLKDYNVQQSITTAKKHGLLYTVWRPFKKPCGNFFFQCFLDNTSLSFLTMY